MHISKAALRRKAYERRNLQQDRERLSRLICNRFVEQEAYRMASSVLWYVDCRSEVITRPAVGEALISDKRTVVPYCTRDEHGEKKLGLWLLGDFAELQPGLWGILEPPAHRRGEAGREVLPEQLDLIMVPGVAFDRAGGRLGNGAGYYDRLLAKVRSDCLLCGVCFESQLVDRIVMEPHDISMDWVITEKAVYAGRGR